MIYRFERNELKTIFFLVIELLPDFLSNFLDYT